MTLTSTAHSPGGRNLPVLLALVAFVLLAVEGLVVLVLSTSRPASAAVPPPSPTPAALRSNALAPAAVTSRRTRAVVAIPQAVDRPASVASPQGVEPAGDQSEEVAAGAETATLIDEYLDRNNSPLIGLGKVFVQQGLQHNVDPRLLVAIAGNETGFGRLLTSRYNAFNWFYRGTWDSHFTSWHEAIAVVTRGIRQYYFDDGRTSIESLGAKYGPIGAENDPENLNVNFIPNVTVFLRELGADPEHLTFD